jgi:hypothetical protein
VSCTLTSPSRGVPGGEVEGALVPAVGGGVDAVVEPVGLVVAVVGAVVVATAVVDGRGMAVGTGSARLSSLQAVVPASASATMGTRNVARRLTRPPG